MPPARRSTPRSMPPISWPEARRRPTPPCVRRGTTPGRRSSADRATSTTPPPPRSGCAIGGFERVAIVDIDAHQGNGTQEIFWERGDVLYASVHVDPGRRVVPAPRRATPTSAAAAPARGGPQRTGSGRQRRRADGSARSIGCCARVESHGSEALVVSLGVDAAVDDPAAPLMMTPARFPRGRRRPCRARPADGVRAGRRLRPRAPGAARPRRLDALRIPRSSRYGGSCANQSSTRCMRSIRRSGRPL